MTGGITAAVAAVASVGIAAYGVSQQAGIASDQRSMANSQLALEKDLYNQQQPYRDQLSQLLADPSSVTKLPGYAFNRDQGAETVARQFASNPGGGGAAALTRYGEDYAAGAYQQQASLLAQLSGLSQNPAAYGSNAVGAGSNSVNAGANSFSSLQQLLAQGGATARLFGPGGGLAVAGTPAALNTSGFGPATGASPYG